MSESFGFSQASGHSNRRCLTSTKIINLINNQFLCMRCFTNITVTSDRYKLSIIHHFINGLYDIHHHKCVSCNDNIINLRPFNECFQCSRKYNELLSKIPRAINLDDVTFRLNILTDSIEGISLQNN